MTVTADIRRQWQAGCLCPLSEASLVQPYGVGLACIHLVALHQQCCRGIRREPADASTAPYTIDAARCGGKHVVALMAQRPADVADGLHSLALPRADAVESVRASNVEVSVEGRDGINLTGQSVFPQYVTVNRWHFNSKDAMRGGSPEHAVTVVGHIRHLIGAKPVGLTDCVEFTVIIVSNYQAFIHRYFDP